MMLYRQQGEQVSARGWLTRVTQHVSALDRQRRVTYGDVLHTLIEAGELASALADGVHGDHMFPAVGQSLDATVSLARAADAVWCGRSIEQSLTCAAMSLDAIGQGDLPPAVTRGVSEGFAYYGVGPELYAEAASRWAASSQPSSVCCIGLRTIGVTLAATATARLGAEGVQTTPLSVRPSGHPFDRQVELPVQLIRRLLANDAGMWFLVIDEGPGLSGSSIAGAARALMEIGVRAEHIVLMPSYIPDFSKLTPSAANTWSRHAVVAADYDGAWISSGRLARKFSAASLNDIAGGNWRAFVALPDQPPVHPDHERRKYLLRDTAATARPRLVKFAGYGRYGAAAIARARTAEEAGWAPPVSMSGDGWMEHPWLTEADREWHTHDAYITQLADYLTFVSETRRCGHATTPATLHEMSLANVRACEGADAARAIESMPMPETVEAVHTDNRLQPHEWLRMNGRLIKTDGVDHGDDHFFPGPTDIAWDVAGVIEEWHLSDAACDALLTRFRTMSGDRRISQRLPFYRLAYLAFRSGYSRLAAERLSDTDDGRRFRRAHVRYRSRLREVLACAC